MKKIRLYLDNCCFNRPFDDQNSIVIKLETEAKLFIQSSIKNGEFELLWSYILDYENHFNPDKGKMNQIRQWKALAVSDIEESDEIFKTIEELNSIGVTSKDALHIACAVCSEADYFLTTDYRLLKKCKNYQRITVINPVDFVSQKENKNENDGTN